MPFFEVTLSDGSKWTIQAHSAQQIRDALKNVKLVKKTGKLCLPTKLEEGGASRQLNR